MNGERHPGEVYKDFRAAVMKILGMQDNPPVFSNGKTAAVPTELSGDLPVEVSGMLTVKSQNIFLGNFCCCMPKYDVLNF